MVGLILEEYAKNVIEVKREKVWQGNVKLEIEGVIVELWPKSGLWDVLGPRLHVSNKERALQTTRPCEQIDEAQIPTHILSHRLQHYSNQTVVKQYPLVRGEQGIFLFC